MKRMTLLMPLLTALLATAAVSGCTSKPASTLDIAAVRAYADTATEVTLQGLSENDLEKYTRYANDEFKAAITPQVLDSAAADISRQLGSFESIEFLSAEESDGYVIVHYRATYSKGKPRVRMVFDQDQLVAGQWFV